jgi:hypothetical protein
MEQSGAYGGWIDADRPPYFLGRETFDVGEDERLPLLRRQSCERRCKPVELFAAGAVPFGVDGIGDGTLAPKLGQPAEEAPDRSSLPRCKSDRDPAQPGSGRVAPVERASEPRNLEEGRLNQVVGVGRGGARSQEHALDAIVVPVEEYAERAEVVALDGAQELGVGGRVAVCWRSRE